MSFACPSCRETGTTLIEGRDCGACCQVCRVYDRALVGFGLDNQRFNAEWKNFMKHARTYHWPKSSHSGNGAPKGAFAFTLDMSPADGLSVDDLVAAARKIMTQKSCPVKKYAWYLEYGDNDTKEHPHIHGMYETEKGGRIESKHFKRAWPIWDESQRLGRGHRGGYHDVVRNDEGYSKYIIEDYALNGVGESYGVDA